MSNFAPMVRPRNEQTMDPGGPNQSSLQPANGRRARRQRGFDQSGVRI